MDPAVKGTLNVLRTARLAGGIRRVVITSSASAVLKFKPPADAGKRWTEDDWNVDTKIEDNAYRFGFGFSGFVFGLWSSGFVVWCSGLGLLADGALTLRAGTAKSSPKRVRGCTWRRATTATTTERVGAFQAQSRCLTDLLCIMRRVISSQTKT